MTPHDTTQDNQTHHAKSAEPRKPISALQPLIRNTFGPCAYETRDLSIKDHKGRVVWEMQQVEVPRHWSNNAANVLAQKYMRRKGVPSATIPAPLTEGSPDQDIPADFRPHIPAPDATFGAERSAQAVFHRLAGAWTYHALRQGLIHPDLAAVFYDEATACLEWQVASPNSPQWFNTGLHWAYGIEGRAGGHFATTQDGHTFPCPNAYQNPQASACFIQSVKDDLVNEGGIMDLWEREARVFKFGSGSGVDVSPIRGQGEPMSGGGVSSGLLSFLKIGDAVGGAIQSGGVTRRAAKMLVCSADHPDIEAFVEWKTREEDKVAALVAGSKLVSETLDALPSILAAHGPHSPQVKAWAAQAQVRGVPPGLLARALQMAEQDLRAHMEPMDAGWQSEAYATVSGQNSNNSVRVSGALISAVLRDEPWTLTRRTDGQPHKIIRARDLWDKIARAAWMCADPGLQFEDTINHWHTVPNAGRINASNPCSEFVFLDDTACNLASINLLRLVNPDRTGTHDGHFKTAYTLHHAARLWTIILEATVGMSGYPTREIAVRSHAFRPLGLGVASLGALLMRMGIPYGSPEAQTWARAIAGLITAAAYETSADLARAAGPFDGLNGNFPHMARVLERHHAALGFTDLSPHDSLYPRQGEVEPHTIPNNAAFFDTMPLIKAADGAFIHARTQGNKYGWRNAQVTVIAPTGTIAIQMDCDTTGIEPPFALRAYKTLAGGGGMEIVNESTRAALAALGWSPQQIEQASTHILRSGDLEGFTAQDLDEQQVDKARRVLCCAAPARPGGACLGFEAHLLMMAAVQPLISGAISKTVNLPASATVDEIARLYLRAHALGLKAVAVYRDGSKLSQPLTAWKAEDQGSAQASAQEPRADHASAVTPIPAEEQRNALLSMQPRAVRERLPADCPADRYRREIGGHVLYFHVGRYPDGRVGEIFLKLAKEGSAMNALGDALTQVASVALQYGVPLETLARIFEGTRFEPAGLVQGSAPLPDSDPIRFATSPLDLVGRELLRHYAEQPQAPMQKQAEPPKGFALWQAKMQAKGLTLAPTLDAQILQWEQAQREGSQALAPEPAPALAQTDAQHSGHHSTHPQTVNKGNAASKANGDPCRACGNFTLARAGSCFACTTCGETTGCS